MTFFQCSDLILVGFGPLFDSVSFNILERHERRRAASLGVANVISAFLVEDFVWISLGGGFLLTMIHKGDFAGL
jgi:hypothetical protein